MNRPGAGPQPIRGMPGAFANQPQVPPNRTAVNRLPNGKMGGNAATWGFGGVPMSNAGLQNQRPSNGPMTSFAQTIGGSQPATPLDLSDFPSLSNGPSQPSASSSQSLWGIQGARNVSQTTGQRTQQSLLQNQQQSQSAQDDMFSAASQLSNPQGNYRFGGQTPVNQIGQSQSNATDDFPPLSRNTNGEISQERTAGLLQNVGFGQPVGSGFGPGTGTSQGARSNGLLNALSAGSRNPPAAPGPSNAMSGLPQSRSPIESSHQGLGSTPERETNPNQSSREALSQQPELRVSSSQNPSSASAQLPPGPQTTDTNLSNIPPGLEPSPEVQDPLGGMDEKERWGLKGLLGVLKGPYQDHAALINGMDPQDLGLELISPERISESIWSPWENAPPRPAVPHFTLPECYQVLNTQPIENKIANFTDDTLMAVFYLNPGDIQQVLAAQELYGRSWRWHKKLKIWLTKDEMMVPQPLGATTERGYYIFWDSKTWQRERRELVLNYNDLEQISNAPAGPVA